MSETPSSRTRSATRTAPSSRTRSRMNAWRWRASIRRPALVPTRPVSIPNDRPLLIRQIAAQRTESQRIPTESEHEPLQSLDTGVSGRDNPADPVGFCRAASEEEYAMADPTRDAVSRRTVLKGMAGAAGLVSVPAIIAACSTPAASGAAARHPPPARAPAHRRRRRPPALGPARRRSARTTRTRSRRAHAGHRRPRSRADRASRSRSTPSTTTRSRTRSALPAGHAGRHLHLVRRLPHAFFADQGLATAIDDVWAKVERQLHRGVQGRLDRQRRQAVYFVPVYNYPWVVFYRKSLFDEKGYTSRRRWTSSWPWATRCRPTA